MSLLQYTLQAYIEPTRYCHLHLKPNMPSLVLRNANQHPSLFPTRELWVNGSNSAKLYNGFGMTEADIDSCTWNRDRQVDCHLHLRRHMVLPVLKNANRHQSLFPTWELWVNGSVSAYLFNGFGLTEADTDSCTPKRDRETTVTCTWDLVNGAYLRHQLYTCASQ